MANNDLLTVICGNMTADPEIRTLQNGSVVANFSIAHNTRRRNQQTNEWEDGDSVFLRCSAWDTQYNTLASNIGNTLRKGMRVMASGQLTQRTYTDRQGVEKTVLELRVEHIGPDLLRNTAQVTMQTGSSTGNGSGQWAGRADTTNQPKPQYRDGTTGQQYATPQMGGAYGSANSADPWDMGADDGEPSF